MKHLICLSFLFLAYFCHSQNQYSVENIPSALKEDANSVVQNETVTIEITNTKKLKITNEIVISVLNKNGKSHLKPYVHFNKSTKIKSVEAIIYDKDGEEVEKFRRKDFIDLSAIFQHHYALKTCRLFASSVLSPSQYSYPFLLK